MDDSPTSSSLSRPELFVSIKNKLKAVTSRVSNFVLDGDSRNIHRAMQRQALEETALFVAEHMYLTRSHTNKLHLIAAALKEVQLPGLFCEFGVHTGTTINFIGSRTKSAVYGFDSFEGLPEDWRPGVEKGTFSVNSLPAVTSNVRLIKGWFDQTLPVFAAEHPNEDVAFLHVDCDLYSSTKTIFEVLGPRIRSGTVIVFDEFFNYPAWKQGEYKAFCEFLDATGQRFEYLGYVLDNEQVAVRIL